MDCKIYFRRAVALLLCCLLAIYTPVLPIAHALDPATIAIAGGQLAGGGLEGAAAASSLAGPVGAIVGVTLGAIGVGTFVSKKAAEQGMSPTEFVVLTIGKYCVAADIAKEQFYKKILDGCAVAADGAISLSNDAAQAIQQFGSWLFTQPDLVVPDVSSGEGISSIDLAGYNFPVGSFAWDAYWDGNKFEESYTMSESCAAVLLLINGSYHPMVFSTQPNQKVSAAGRWNFNGTLTSTANGYYYYMVPPAVFNSKYYVINNIPVVPASGESSFFNSLPVNPAWDVNSGAVAGDEVFVGTPEAWAEHKDVLNPSADEDTPAAVLNPDLLNPIIEQLAEGTQWQMGIEDYLKALQAAFDQSITGIGDRVADLTDVVTGIKKEIAIPDDATKTADLTKPDVKPIDTPVIQPAEVNPDKAIDGISFELDKVFPFCLPFDVYKMLNLLSADPVAPRYHVHYEGPYSIVIDFTVDLSAWNNVAAICRNMELLLFCIGLAVATRSIFIRA